MISYYTKFWHKAKFDFYNNQRK